MRFKVIADYPQSIFRVGEIIETKSGLIYCDDKGPKYSDFPHLFEEVQEQNTQRRRLTVNFNNLRKQALFAYDRLTKTMNANTKEDEWNKWVEVDVEEIQNDMDDLRRLLFSVACVYVEGDEDFKDVSEEAEPIACFNED